MAQALDSTENDALRFRIGINIGDVIADDDDIYGDGVNVAARLQELQIRAAYACPGASSIKSKPRSTSISKIWDVNRLKNIPEPVRVYRVRLDETAAAEGDDEIDTQGWRWQLVALAVVVGLLIGIGVYSTWRFYLGAPVQQTSLQLPQRATQDLPSIAVLPFENMSNDPSQEYFSDGITEDLITDLSQVSGLFVIARSTTFDYKGKSVNVSDVGRDLNVRYVLEGSVRKAGDRVRINAQLIDAQDGGHVWADRFDRELTDVFALQDEVTRKIVSALAVRLTSQEDERLRDAAKVNPDAYDMLLRGVEHLLRFTQADNREAQRYFEKAVFLDPEFARAHADLAYSHGLDVLSGWTEDRDESVRQATKYVEKAAELDDSLALVHFAYSNVHRAAGRLEQALSSARRAIELDPNYADGYGSMAITLNYLGAFG